jgi:hypothetical protein
MKSELRSFALPAATGRLNAQPRNAETTMSTIASVPGRRAPAFDGIRAAGIAVARWWVSYTAWRIERLAARLRKVGSR